MPDKIKLYSLSTCGHCRRVKKLLDKHKIEYEFLDVDMLSVSEKGAVLAEIKAVNPAMTFPTMVMGDLVIVGFQIEKIQEALGI